MNNLYVGKFNLDNVYIEISNDKITLINVRNVNTVNISIPYCETAAIRYCVDERISALFIQPIYQSFKKIYCWFNSGKEPNYKDVPENYIMMKLTTQPSISNIGKMKRAASYNKQDIIINKMSVEFALNLFKKPNKVDHNKQPKNETREEEVIEIEDDDVIEDKNNSILHNQILCYRISEAKQICLYGSDLNCLREGQYLNDNIMNFYLKYFQLNSSDISETILHKIHIYDPLFATYLLNSNIRKRKVNQNDKYQSVEYLDDPYHSTGKKWTKDVDIFSKEFLLIPLVKDSHWFLIIICYIGNIISDDLDGGQNHGLLEKTPTIIFMDSFASYYARDDICKNIATYLSLELKEKRGLDIKSDQFKFKVINPKVPQQNNYYDCGLFVLEYIERFIKSPEVIYNKLMENSSALEYWFNSKMLKSKRATIQQTILNLLPPEEAKQLQHELTKLQLNIDIEYF